MVRDHRISGQHQDRNTLVGIGLILMALSLGALVLLAGAADAAPSALRHGDPVVPQQAFPTLTGSRAAIAVDLDGDGAPETITYSGEGTLQRYNGNGRYAWSVDTQEVLTAAGLFGETAGHFMGGHRAALAPAPADPVFTDLDGDGVQDVIAVLLLAEDAPGNRYHSALLRIDGASGQIDGLTLHDGVLRTLLMADFDGDADQDLFLVAEDGTPTLVGDHTIGTGGPMRLWVEDATSGTVVWSDTRALDFAQVTAAGVAVITGPNPDVVLAVTEPLGSFHADLDQNATPRSQDLIAIGGATGITLWDVPLGEGIARGLVIHDYSADGIDDVIVRIQESAARSPSLGDARARLQGHNGMDGVAAWTLDTFGAHPSLHDAVHYSDTRVAVAYTERSTTSYPAEDIEKVALVDVRNGRMSSDLRLSSSVGLGLDILPAVLGLPPIDRPEAVSDRPRIDTLELALADIDGDGVRDLVTGSDRAMNGVRVGASSLSTVWSTPTAVGDGFFHAVERPSGTEVWLQPAGSDRYAAYRPSDGGLLRETPLVGLMTGLAMADLDGDSVTDRAIGGASGTVFAFKGSSEVPLWQRDLGATVLDLAHTDGTGDGRADILVVTTEGRALLDGRDGDVRWTLPNPSRVDTGTWIFADLDRDAVLDVVIGTRTDAGVASISAYRGTDGGSMWTRSLPPPAVRVSGLAVGHLTADATLDVAYTTQSGNSGLHYGAGAISGATGLPLWRSDGVGYGGASALERNSVQIVDANGDQRLDVVVALRGGETTPPSLRAHEGRTGLKVWEKTMGDGLTASVGLWKGFIGPAGSEALLFAGQHESGTLVSYVAPGGGVLRTIDYPGLTHLTDVATGEVDGDGVHDVVLAAPDGLVGIDSGPTLAGNTAHLGHMTRYAATKVRLVDPDGDGRHAVAFLSHERNHPVAHGADPFLDAFRAKAVGVASLTGGTTTPTNAAPVVQILQETDAVQGEVVRLRSTSFDPDGALVNETWRFPDGTQQYGRTANHTWHTPGTKTVHLMVMDEDGAVTVGTLDVEVQPIYGHTVTPFQFGGFASPGSDYVFNFTVENSGVENDTYRVDLLRAPSGWDVTVGGPAEHALTSGQAVEVAVNVSIDVPRPLGEVEIQVTSTVTGQRQVVAHRVLVPLNVSAELFRGTGPYSPVDDVAGSARFTWHDSTPVVGMVLELTTDAGQSTNVTTGPDGRVEFVVPKDLLLVNTPGLHHVKLQPMFEHYTSRYTLQYHVEPIA